MTLPNLNHLKYFVDAVQLGSISLAAEKNLVTHPAISRAINSLEAQLDVKLLVHKKKNFEVTKAGLQMAEKAKLLLSAAITFNANSTKPTHEIAGIVRLGISRTLGQIYLSQLIKILNEKHPGIKLIVKFGTTYDLTQQLNQGHLDTILTLGFEKQTNLKQQKLHQGQYVLIQSAKNEKLTSKDLPNQNILLTESRYETELFKKEYFKKFKAKIQDSHEIESWDMITKLVINNCGIGLVPDILASTNQEEVISLKLDWFKCDYNIYLSQSKPASVDLVKQSVAKIIDTLF